VTLTRATVTAASRGMWANYVLNALGLPPSSSSRLDHMRWWWRAHNMVSDPASQSVSQSNLAAITR